MSSHTESLHLHPSHHHQRCRRNVQIDYLHPTRPFLQKQASSAPNPNALFCAALKPSLGQDSPLSAIPYAFRRRRRRRQKAEPSIRRDSVPQTPPSEQRIYAAPGLGFICGRVSETRPRRGREEAAYLALSVGEGNVDEAAGVELALVGATLGRLLLLLGLDLL